MKRSIYLSVNFLLLVLLIGCATQPRTRVFTEDESGFLPTGTPIIDGNSGCTESGHTVSISTANNINIRNCTNPQLISLTVSGLTSPVLLVLNSNPNAINSIRSTGLLPKADESFEEMSLLSEETDQVYLKNDVIVPSERHRISINNMQFSKNILEDILTAEENVRHFNVLRMDNDTARDVKAYKITSNAICEVYVEDSVSNNQMYIINRVSGTPIGPLDSRLNTLTFGNYILSRFQTIYNKANESGSIGISTANGKVVLLFTNIEYPTTDFSGITGIIAGYFYPTDPNTGSFLNPNTHILYINVLTLSHNGFIPNTLDDTLLSRTIAHEYHHLVTYMKREKESSKGAIDTWLNESSAEFFADYAIGPIVNQVSHVKAGGSTIQNGLPLFYWQSDALQYSMGYIYLKYLEIQSGLTQKEILNAIINSNKTNYGILEDIFITNGNGKFANIRDMYAKYLLATFINSSTGIYGFQNSLVFNFASKRGVAFTTVTSTILRPGGRVFKQTDSSSIASFSLTTSHQNDMIYIKLLP